MTRLPWVTAVATVALAVPAPALADPIPQFFSLPAQLKGVSLGLDVTPDGVVYFGATDNTEQPPIGRLDPALATPGTANGITSVKTPEDPVSSGSANIRDVVWSPTLNALWFTRSDLVVGRLDGTTVTLKQVPVPPWGIGLAADGGAWFTEWGEGPEKSGTQDRDGNRIAYIAPGLGIAPSPNLALQPPNMTYDKTRNSAKPQGLTVGPDGRPWFVENDAGLPGYRIATWDAGRYIEYKALCVPGAYCSGEFSGSSLEDVAVAADGTVWYTNGLKRTIGRLVPGGDVTEYTLASMDSTLAGSRPRGIKPAVDGTLWAAIQGSTAGNALVRIDPSTLSKQVYKLGATTSPWDVVPDTKGNVWFTGTPAVAGASWIGRLPGVVGAAPPPPPSGGGTVTPPAPAPGPAATQLTPAGSGKAQITDPTVRGDTITANQICVGPPQDRCSLVYLVQTHEYVTGFPGSHTSAKPKLTTIGKATVTLRGGQSSKVKIKLNSKGRKLLKKIKKFKATLTVTESHNGAKAKQVLKRNVKFKR